MIVGLPEAVRGQLKYRLSNDNPHKGRHHLRWHRGMTMKLKVLEGRVAFGMILGWHLAKTHVHQFVRMCVQIAMSVRNLFVQGPGKKHVTICAPGCVTTYVRNCGPGHEKNCVTMCGTEDIEMICVKSCGPRDCAMSRVKTTGFTAAMRHDSKTRGPPSTICVDTITTVRIRGYFAMRICVAHEILKTTCGGASEQTNREACGLKICEVFSSSAVERRCAFSERSPRGPCHISILHTATIIPTMVLGVHIPMCCHGKTQCQKRVHRLTMRAFLQSTASRPKKSSEVMKGGVPAQTGAALLGTESGKMVTELGQYMVSLQ
mmetsp:Transcript_110769/g.220305  ORF Transcript_110769/g.220305 Transcript_110769/m.220305 type:complete len:319 (+) Transcript_110769:1038-1994(+)